MALTLPDDPAIDSVDRRSHICWRWSDLAPLGIAYVALTALWALIGTLIVSSDAITDADTSISEWFANHRTPRLDDLTHIGSTLSDTPVKVGFTALAAILMVVAWRRALEPIMVIAPLILEASVFITVTWIVGRPRPGVPRLEDSPVDSSFPSGHVAAAAVYSAMLIVLFWHTRRRVVRWCAVTLVTLVVAAVGFSRLYRGMHHLTDVVLGLVLGLLSVAVCWWLIRSKLVRNDEALVDHA